MIPFWVIQWRARSKYARGWYDVSLPYETPISEEERKAIAREEESKHKNQA